MRFTVNTLIKISQATGRIRTHTETATKVLPEKAYLTFQDQSLYFFTFSSELVFM